MTAIIAPEHVSVITQIGHPIGNISAVFHWIA